MTVYVRALETAVPPTLLIQHEARDVFAAQPGLTRLGSRLVSTCFDSAAIDTRYTAVRELTLDSAAEDPQFFDPQTGLLRSPSTKARNNLFAEEATKLFIEAADAAVSKCDGIDPPDVTHLITVSCTGFFNPGPDYKIVRALGLNPAVQRYHLGFMGCYAAIPALRLAAQLCEADASAVVLVVSVELCTLHLRSSNDPDTIVASSLFADGAAAGIVTSRPPAEGERSFDLDRFATRITPVGEGDMAWKIGDHGFEMVLSNAIPAIIDEHITGALEPLFEHDTALAEALATDGSSDAVEHWAIHPGGRSILDKVESRLGLTEAQLVPARETLRDFGNMSSATVLFVLRNILESEGAGDGDRVAAMAFGPGLTVETALLTVRA
jgi:predicted naringenin-chalcone synthase